jgi:Bacterial PH domain
VAGRAILPLVRIRDPRPPDEPDEPHDDWADVGPEAAPRRYERPRDSTGDLRPRRTEISFRVPTRVIVAKFAVALLLLALTLAFAVHEQVPIGVVATLAFAAYAARDVVARERLRADSDGIVAARGYAGRRRLDWSEVQRFTVDSHLRLGARTETLELDAGEEIFLFGWSDLGMAPEQALTALEEICPPDCC